MAFFEVVDRAPSGAVSRAFLVTDNWDDWNKYRTQFTLVIFDDTGAKHEPGAVKIASVGLNPGPSVAPGVRAPQLPREFDRLDDAHFSLGQGETYYETLNTLPEAFRNAVLVGLRDCAFDLQLFDRVLSEYVMRESLLRDVAEQTVRARLHRLAMGDARLTMFRFAFDLSSSSETDAPVELTFNVTPHSNPPSNVHVLIGRNGVGKSRCMLSMIRALANDRSAATQHGAFRFLQANPFTEIPDWQFAGLVFVSFSAFDGLTVPSAADIRVKASVVGLQRLDSGAGASPAAKSREELRRDFLESFEACRRGLRADRLRAAVTTLANDPLFAEADIASHLDNPSNDWREDAARLFDRLSSGHAIVLLTITRLVELVDEKTLVLLDEPEGHLHPPLLSAFIRSLADLLARRNGVAIISTHSPVVLQEVPRACVWKLRRSGLISNAERPNLETFGENVGVLTREIFGLEVTSAGFHRILKDAIEVDRLSYDELLAKFNGQLGAEARAIARVLIADRDTDDQVTP